MSDEPGWTSPSWDPTQPGAREPRPQGAGTPPPTPPPPPPGSYTGPPPGGYAAAPSYPAPPPPGYGYGYQQAPKPGIIPLRPMGVGEILDGAVSVIRQNWRSMIGLALFVGSVTGLIQFVLKVTVLRDLSTGGSFDSNGLSTRQSLSSSDASGLVGFLATSALGWVATILLTGMFTVIVSQAVLGQRTTLSAAWARVRPRVWRLIGLAILVPLCWVLGAVACIIPGIFLYVALAVSSPALILEGAGVTGAMRRSFGLVKNLWWRTFGILLLTALIAGVVGVVVSLPLLLIGGFSAFSTNASDASYVLLQVLATIGGILAGALTYPFTASVGTLLYVDMRMRKEGLDIELMRATGTTPPSGGQYGGSQFGGGNQFGQYGQPPA